ncbi:MAG: ABC transporter ATP-binding protein [Aliishimia sp.]
MLEVSALDAFYGDFHALFDVSFALNPGETLAVVGANGAGKSSLLGAICGLVTTRGEVRLNGKNLTNLSTPARAKAGIALSPEGRRMFTSLSVRENLLMGARVGRKGPWDLSSVGALFPILEEFADRPAGLLSGGQQQMVAIGRALMANPVVLLLDEVSLGLAPVIAEEVHAALAKLRGTSEMMTLIVEQDVRRALGGSDHYLCLLEGRDVMNGLSNAVDFDALSRAYFGESAA